MTGLLQFKMSSGQVLTRLYRPDEPCNKPPYGATMWRRAGEVEWQECRGRWIKTPEGMRWRAGTSNRSS